MALLWVLFAVWALWLWLSGHWFGRVLAFLVFGGGGAVMALVILGPEGPTVALPGAAGALVAAWLIAALPHWICDAAVRRDKALVAEMLDGVTWAKNHSVPDDPNLYDRNQTLLLRGENEDTIRSNFLRWAVFFLIISLIIAMIFDVIRFFIIGS